MTEEQHDWTSDLIKRYWPLGGALGALFSAIWLASATISTMESNISQNTNQIAQNKQDIVNIYASLNRIEGTTIQNQQELADIDRKVSPGP